jgi:hypothetical protein
LDILQEIEEKLIEPEKNPNILIDTYEPYVEYCSMAFYLSDNFEYSLEIAIPKIKPFMNDIFPNNFVSDITKPIQVNRWFE